MAQAQYGLEDKDIPPRGEIAVSRHGVYEKFIVVLTQNITNIFWNIKYMLGTLVYQNLLDVN